MGINQGGFFFADYNVFPKTKLCFEKNAVNRLTQPFRVRMRCTRYCPTLNFCKVHFKIFTVFSITVSERESVTLSKTLLFRKKAQ